MLFNKSFLSQGKDTFSKHFSLDCPRLLRILGAFAFCTLFFGVLLCLCPFSYDFSTLMSCVTEPYGFTRGRSLSVLASWFSHSVVPPCLHVAHLWGFGHQVDAIPFVLLPHRCLLHSHGCVYISDFSGIFPFDAGTYARTLLHCVCSADCSVHNLCMIVRVSLQPLWDSQCFVVRDRLRCASRGSRLSVWGCESPAPGEASQISVCPKILPAAGWFWPSRVSCFPISPVLILLLGSRIVCLCCWVLRIRLFVIWTDGCADGCPPLESLTLFWALQPL